MNGATATADVWTASVARLVLRLALITAILFGSVHVLLRLRSLVATLFIATIIAYIIRPIAEWMAHTPGFRRVHTAAAAPFARLIRSRRTPRPLLTMRFLIALASFYALVAIFVGGWYSTKYLISPFTIEIKNVQENWQTYRDKLETYQRGWTSWYTHQIKPEYRKWIEAQFRAATDNGAVKSNATQWLGIGLRRTGEYMLIIVELVLIPVLAFYFAVESRTLKHEFVGLLPRRRRRETLRMIEDFNQIMFSFVVCQAVLCLIAGIVVGVGLAALGVPYPLSLGILAGLTRAIPIIGPIIGGIPIVLLALATRGVGVAVGVLAFFSILHFIESKFLMPLMIGDSLSLHPVVIIVVLLIGQEFGGLLGMFFAAPLAALVRIAIRRYWLPVADRKQGVSAVASPMIDPSG